MIDKHVYRDDQLTTVFLGVEMRRSLIGIAIAILAPACAFGSTIQEYTIQAQGSVSNFELLALTVIDKRIDSQVPNFDVDEIVDTYLASNPYFSDIINSTVDSARVRVGSTLLDTNFSDCSGLLRTLCGGSVFSFNLEPLSADVGNGVSFITQLTNSSLRYEDDSDVGGESENYIFFNSGSGVLLNLDFNEISISAVPLPAGGALLISSIGAFGYIGRRRRKSVSLLSGLV